MTHINYLYQLATLRRIRRCGLISRATYARRLAQLIHEYAGVPFESFEDHATAAIEVTR